MQPRLTGKQDARNGQSCMRPSPRTTRQHSQDAFWSNCVALRLPRLETLEREYGWITSPDLLQAFCRLLRGGRVVLGLLGFHEAIEGPAVVRELCEALYEHLLCL